MHGPPPRLADVIHGWDHELFHPKAKPASLALFQRHGEHHDSRHVGIHFGTDDPEFERFSRPRNGCMSASNWWRTHQDR